MNKPLFPDVIVNETRIPAADIAAEAQNHDAPRGKPGLAWRAAARALVVRRLLLDEAARRGIEATPQDLGERRYETGDEANIRALLDAAIDPAPVSDDDALAVYRADPDRFRAPPLFEASHILIAADETTRDDAWQRAKALAEVLSDQPDRFEALAASVSDCGSRSNGGRLGQLSRGDTVPEFEAVLEQLDEGAICGQPVASRYGFHIIRLDARARGRVLPFEAARKGILSALERQGQTAAAVAFLGQLIGAAKIVGIDMNSPAPPPGK